MPPRTDSSFEAKRDAARVWEEKLARWTRRRGWYVLGTYDFSGKGDDKAPKLYAPTGGKSLVLPDLQCFKDGSSRWLECKYKATATLYRKGGYRTTGISLRLWEHYKQVEQVTGADVVLAFLHEAEREIRGDTLAALDRVFSHEYRGHLMGSSGMRFWKYDEIRCWGALAQLDAEAAS